MNSNTMTSSKIKNNILKTILAPWYREWLKQWKYQKVFVFSEEGFEFFKFYEKEAKTDIHKFKRGLAVLLDVQNSWNYWKNRLPFASLLFQG